MATVLINAFFKDEGVPVTGLSPAIDIWNLDTDTLAVDGAAMSEVGGGNYKYIYTSYDPTVNYSFIADGGAGLANAERYLQAGNDDPPLLAPKLPTNFIMGSGVATDKDDEIDAIKAKTDNLPAAPAAVGSAMTLEGDLTATMKASVNAEVDTAIETYHLDHLLAATYDPASKPGAADALLNELVGNDGGVSQFTANALELAPTGGSAPTAVEIRQEIDTNSTQLAAIVADTNELQVDWVNGGRLDNILDARASQASVDTIDDFLDTEVAAILEDTGTTLPAQISALNNLSAEQVNAEVDTALADINLDHLVKNAVDTDFPTTVHLNSVLGHIADNGTSASFDRTTDSLEALQAEHDATQAAVTLVDDFVDTEVAAIKAQTDKLTFDGSNRVIADAQAISASTTAADNIEANISNLNATVSSRSSHSAADVWAAGTRTLTSFGTLVADIWANATRTLSSFGSLVSDIWANGTRTITGGTVTTNSDKTGYSISGIKTTLDALNDVSTAQVKSEVDTALADIHLDHLLATDYDPASKPGTSTALLNELIWNDGGVSQFTANALELAPSSATAAAIADAVLEELLAEHDHVSGGLAEQIQLVRKLLQNRVAHSSTTITIYDDDSTTPLLTRTPKDKNGVAINVTNYDANIPAEVTRAA